MIKKLFLMVIVVVVIGALVLSPGLLSIFGPSGPTQTDVFLRDGILGTYISPSRELMSAAEYEDGEVMSARAGLIVSNPRSLGFCGYQLNSARYAWVPNNADGLVVFPGASTNVAPTGWPMVFLPPDSDPGSRLIYEFSPDTWTGNGQPGVVFVSFSLIIGYAIRAGCSDPWIDKLEVFAADGAVITASIIPPPGDPPVDPPPVDPLVDDPPVNGDTGDGEADGFDFQAILVYLAIIVGMLLLIVILAFLPVPMLVKVVIFGVAVVVLVAYFTLFTGG